MKTNKRTLMKHFSAILRKRALATSEVNENINLVILKSLNRKELIQIIKDKYDGSIPKQYSLAELENEELLNIIGDDMYIIAYVTQKWVRVAPTKKQPNSVNKNLIDNIDTAITKAVVKESKATPKKEVPATTKPIKKK